jgi:murein DD-endopeptidase MepM/ murein hydrolase activator NlpD
MVRNFQESQITTWEYQDQDVYGIRRFLPPNTTIGEAWPNAEKELRPPTKPGEVRPCCKGGAGGFLATRNDHGSIRFHAGTDYVDRPGDPIYAPMSGWVERIKNPGRPGLSGLLVTNEKGYTASIYYVEPSKEIRNALKTPTVDGVTKNRYRVEAGKTVIGFAQDLHPMYPADVPQHVHVTLTDPGGNPVAPDGKVRIRKTPKEETAEK